MIPTRAPFSREGCVAVITGGNRGIVQLTKAMAVEQAPYHIQVNAVAPGWIATKMRAMARNQAQFAEFAKMILARTPAARGGETDEIAGAAVFRIRGRRLRHRDDPAGGWRLFDLLDLVSRRLSLALPRAKICTPPQKPC